MRIIGILFHWTNNFIIHLMSIDTCHLNSKLNFILSSTVIKKKRCDSIIIWTIFSFYPAWFPNKNQMKPIPYERKKWSNPRETSGRFSYLLLTCVTGLLADSTSRGKLVEEEGEQLAAPLGGRAKAIALSAPASHFCSNRDRDEEKFGLGSWVKLLSLWKRGKNSGTARAEGKEKNK